MGQAWNQRGRLIGCSNLEVDCFNQICGRGSGKEGRRPLIKDIKGELTALGILLSKEIDRGRGHTLRTRECVCREEPWVDILTMVWFSELLRDHSDILSHWNLAFMRDFSYISKHVSPFSVTSQTMVRIPYSSISISSAYIGAECHDLY